MGVAECVQVEGHRKSKRKLQSDFRAATGEEEGKDRMTECRESCC